MLKNTLTGICLALTMTSFAQEKADVTTAETPNFNYSEVVEVSGATKDQLFKSARSWFLENYGIKKQEAGVIYTDDSYLGEIAASPIMWVFVNSMGSSANAGSISYNIVVSAKEGKYKLEINDYYHESNRSAYGTGGTLTDETPDCGVEEMTELVWGQIKEEGKSKTEVMITSLKERMTAASSHVEGEDW